MRPPSRTAFAASGVLLSLVVFALFSGDSPEVPRGSGPLSQSAYVWRMAWDGPVSEAVRIRAPGFSGIVVLAAEVDWRSGHPSIRRANPDWSALAATSGPVGLAIRIERFGGPFSARGEPAAALRQLARSLVREAGSQNVPVAELQLDFDCAGAKLPGYQLWVEAVRKEIRPTPVGITALPSWLNQRSCRDLFAAADSVTLQVHSLERPIDESTPVRICDPDAARRAIERAAQLGVPFRVALPTYGYLLAFDERGTFAGASAEGPRPDWPKTHRLRALRTDPAAMADLVNGWTRERPAALQGVVWYRLPVAGEQFNWTWPTLASVMKGARPEPRLIAQAERTRAGLHDLTLANRGTCVDTNAWTVSVTWENARLLSCDGLSNFEIRNSDDHSLILHSRGLVGGLPPGKAIPVAWLRLDSDHEAQLNIKTETVAP